VVIDPVADASMRPRPLPQPAAYADALLVGQPLCPLYADERHPALSALGPGGVGPLWLMSRETPAGLRALIQAAYGRYALFMRPWVAVMPFANTGPDMDGNPRDVTATGDVRMTVRELGRRRSVNTRCPVCFSASQVEDPWHVVHECESPHVVAARARVHDTAGAVLAAVLRGLVAAHDFVAPVPPGLLADVDAAVATLVLPEVVEVVEVVEVEVEIVGDAAPDPPPHPPLLDWASAQGRFILYRLLLLLPFPATAAGPGQAHVARLGRVFDAVQLPRRHLAHVIRPWVRWAAHHVRKLAAARQLAHKDKGVRNRALAAARAAGAGAGAAGGAGAGVPLAPAPVPAAAAAPPAAPAQPPAAAPVTGLGAAAGARS
jgi:hypothetical protein